MSVNAAHRHKINRLLRVGFMSMNVAHRHKTKILFVVCLCL
jgi:hypothetical protein